MKIPSAQVQEVSLQIMSTPTFWTSSAFIPPLTLSTTRIPRPPLTKPLFPFLTPFPATQIKSIPPTITVYHPQPMLSTIPPRMSASFTDSSYNTTDPSRDDFVLSHDNMYDYLRNMGLETPAVNPFELRKRRKRHNAMPKEEVRRKYRYIVGIDRDGDEEGLELVDDSTAEEVEERIERKMKKVMSEEKDKEVNLFAEEEEQKRTRGKRLGRPRAKRPKARREIVRTRRKKFEEREEVEEKVKREEIEEWMSDMSFEGLTDSVEQEFERQNGAAEKINAEMPLPEKSAQPVTDADILEEKENGTVERAEGATTARVETPSKKFAEIGGRQGLRDKQSINGQSPTAQNGVASGLDEESDSKYSVSPIYADRHALIRSAVQKSSPGQQYRTDSGKTIPNEDADLEYDIEEEGLRMLRGKSKRIIAHDLHRKMKEHLKISRKLYDTRMENDEGLLPDDTVLTSQSYEEKVKRNLERALDCIGSQARESGAFAHLKPFREEQIKKKTDDNGDVIDTYQGESEGDTIQDYSGNGVFDVSDEQEEEDPYDGESMRRRYLEEHKESVEEATDGTIIVRRKKKRGRPRKQRTDETVISRGREIQPATVGGKRKRGRPRKGQTLDEVEPLGDPDYSKLSQTPRRRSVQSTNPMNSKNPESDDTSNYRIGRALEKSMAWDRDGEYRIEDED